MNKPLNPIKPGTRRLTRQTLTFAAVVYVGAPIVLVYFWAADNFYTRMEQWYAMNISLQSVDPTRVAIDDPEADISILESLVTPELRRSGFVRDLHAQWRADRNWAIREGDLEEFNITRDTANVVVLLRMDSSSAEGMSYREVRQRTSWERIGRAWYLASLKNEDTEDRFEPWPGIVVP